MSTNKATNRILDKIKALEVKTAKLLPLRKEEIFDILQSNGGLTLDNKLLAGLAIYGAHLKNSESNLLREFAELGKTKIPSSGTRGGVKKTSKANTVQSNTNSRCASHG
jgi:hypothetical protein